MDRLTSNKGFMLIELCAAIMIMTVMTLLYLPSTDINDFKAYTFGDAYLEKQSEAMSMRDHVSYESDSASVTFNEKGNVSQAATLNIDGHEIVIELGGGRLVFK